MATIITINSWNRDMVPDKRTSDVSAATLSQRFDSQSKPSSLIPYRDMVTDTDGETSLGTDAILKLLSDGSHIWAMGSDTSGHTQLLKKTFATDSWGTVAAATSSSSTNTNKTFVYYKNQDTIYGSNSVGIFSYDIGGSTFTYNENTSVTPSGQGVVHSKDDVLYIPCGSVIASKNGSGSWSNDAFDGLPADFSSTSVAEYLDYLIIAGNRSDVGTVYFWNRDSSVDTADAKYTLPGQTIAWCDDVGGTPVICSKRTSALTGHEEAVFTAIIANELVEILSFDSGSSAGVTMYGDRQRNGNALEFLMDLNLEGTLYAGIWKLTRHLNGTYALAFVMNPRNDDSDTTNTNRLLSFFRTQGVYFISYQNPDADAYRLWRTDSTNNTYVGTAIRQTVVNPDMKDEETHTLKQLKAIALYHDAIADPNSVEIDYRVDGGDWTTIKTNSTVDDVATISLSDSNGSAFKTGREYEFRLKSNGVTINALSYAYERLSPDL